MELYADQNSACIRQKYDHAEIFVLHLGETVMSGLPASV